MKKKNKTKCKVFSYDLYGLQGNKYKTLQENDISLITSELPIDEFNEKFKSTKWGKERFKEDLNFFVIKDSQNILEYGNFWGITDIFQHLNSGIESQRDKFAIKRTKDEIQTILSDFKKISDDEVLRKKYNLPEDSDTWKMSKVKFVFNNSQYDNKNISSIHYRPFDVRYTYLTKDQGFLARPRFEIMNNFIDKENIGLVYMQQVVLNAPYSHFFVVNEPIDRKLFSSSEGANSISPLYMYVGVLHSSTERTVNFKADFNEFIKTIYPPEITPEQIFCYIYTIGYSPTYRKKYLEFLNIDFPRIPFNADYTKFLKLATIGQELIDLHLMKKSYAENECQFYGNGTNYKIEKIHYGQNRLYINNDRYFTPISEEIWNFYIGGHQVLDNWLKNRQKDDLDIDVKQFIRIVNIASNTIRLMNTIDNLTHDWI